MDEVNALEAFELIPGIRFGILSLLTRVCE